ncbi:hypothetical protein AcV5_003199 [Taiwanofungus camphoratus]|nr:hypothetical protein AcV5_003199 [Antrodia cinnamomea]
MLRTLLTPLSAHFALSPRAEASTDTTHESDALTPEDFTRDVLVELMKKSVERLKVADGLSMKTEVLVEIHKIMLEDARTKDVFREMDGFLVVMNALSTLPAADPAKEAKFSDKMRTEIVEAARLVFMILSEAMFQHQENAEYFKCSVGYESLSEAMLGLVSNTTISNDVIGFLVSLALHKFSMSGIFEFAPNTDYAELDRSIRDFEPAFGLIQQPDALLVLYNFLPLVSTNGPALRYCIYRLLERLSYHNHRNHCILNSIGLVEPLFHQYCKLKDDASVSKQERQIVQKLLRRLADAGTTTDHARLMFQRVVRADDTLDTDVLEVLRAGMKVKWPEHFSLESPAALRIWKEGARALPSTGFTFMVINASSH